MNVWHDVEIKDMRWLFLVFNSELCIKWQNMLKESWSSSITMSIAMLAIPWNNTLGRTQKRNTKKRLELVQKHLISA